MGDGTVSGLGHVDAVPVHVCRHVVAHGEVLLAAPSFLVVVVDVVTLPTASTKSSGGEPCAELK